MSDYTTIQSNLASRIRLATGFTVTPTNVFENDNRVLSGGPTRAVVLTFGSYSKSLATFREVLHEWTVNVDLYEQWQGTAGQSGALASINTDRQYIIDTIDSWALLNGTTGLLLAEIISAGPIEPLSVGRTAYIRQRLVCRAREKLVVSY
jgi:hypothetical protein